MGCNTSQEIPSYGGGQKTTDSAAALGELLEGDIEEVGSEAENESPSCSSTRFGSPFGFEQQQQPTVPVPIRFQLFVGAIGTFTTVSVAIRLCVHPHPVRNGLSRAGGTTSFQGFSL
uniref:Uncharacterized protein n=1 Tax=Anopheles culicifacies TaxID=139723 RepID=A0A182MT23_9DIPT